MSRTEEPRYSLIESHGSIEIRDYEPMIVAETQVSGLRKEAINQGFRRIAAYIFGANALAEKIPMTAPVAQQRVPAPGGGVADREVWRVRFVMPRAHTLETLPQPSIPEVALIPFGPRRYAVIRFSGSSGDENIRRHRDMLREFADGRGLACRDEPVLAFYNPPWTLPFLRRNEIWLELASEGAD